MKFKPAFATAILAMIATLPAAAPATAQVSGATAGRPAAPEPAVPPADYQISLTRSALAALNQANLTGNYTVLSQYGASGFNQGNPPERLAASFAAFRTNRIDLTPTAVLNPQFSVAPFVREGKLRLIGRFPSQPMRVNFDLTFVPEQGQWRLFGLAVNLEQAGRE